MDGIDFTLGLLNFPGIHWIQYVADLYCKKRCSVKCCLSLFEKFNQHHYFENMQLKDHSLMNSICTESDGYENLLQVLPDTIVYHLDAYGKSFLHYLIRPTRGQKKTKQSTIEFLLNKLDLAKLESKHKDSMLHYSARHCKDRLLFEMILAFYYRRKNKDFLSFIKNIKSEESVISLANNNRKLTVIGIGDILLSQNETFDINSIILNDKSLLNVLCGDGFENVKFHHELIIKLLNSDDLNINDPNQLYLHHAFKHASRKVIEMIFEYQSSKINFDQIDSDGKTALFNARKRDSETFLFIINQNKFDLRVKDKQNGQNILHYYCNFKKCKKEIVERIIDLSERSNLQSIIYEKDNKGNIPSVYAKLSDKNDPILNMVMPKGKSYIFLLLFFP